MTNRTGGLRVVVLVASIAAVFLCGNFPEARGTDEKSSLAPASVAPAIVSASSAKSTPPSADQALQRLMEGNVRYVTGKPIHPDQTSERRIELAKGQSPFAVVLTCADSRVAPELLFDQGLGDLFVIRNAGNVLDDHVIGSIEYAVEHRYDLATGQVQMLK